MKIVHVPGDPLLGFGENPLERLKGNRRNRSRENSLDVCRENLSQFLLTPSPPNKATRCHDAITAINNNTNESETRVSHPSGVLSYEIRPGKVMVLEAS